MRKGLPVSPYVTRGTGANGDQGRVLPACRRGATEATLRIRASDEIDEQTQASVLAVLAELFAE